MRRNAATYGTPALVDGAALVLVVTTMLAVACTSESRQPGAGAESEAAPHREGSASSPQPRRDAAANRVTLSETAYATARILVEPVARESPGAPSGGLEAPGVIAFDPARVAIISPRVAGRLERLSAAEGDRVAAGQLVAYLLSPAYLTAQTDFIQATRRADLLAGTPDAEGAAALAAAARRRLVLFGASDAAIARLEGGGEPNTLLELLAPFNGSITEVSAVVGATVEPGAPVYRLANLSVVNAITNLPERALPVVHEGQPASIEVAAFPSAQFSGRVLRLSSELDSTTRTVRAIVRVPNPKGRLRAGMFATVRLAIPTGAAVGTSGPGALLTIPESAVVTDGEDRYVFVEVAPRTFERRAVETVPLAPPGSAGPNGGRVVVRAGLRAGERVVVRGAFTLKSELTKSRLGEQEG